MRILNRPMFKYGGPIKEGVMHGMKNGGSMGNNQGPRRAALVGNPIYPQTGGREHHVLPYMIGQGIYAAGRMLARPFGSWVAKQIAKKGVTSPGAGLIRSGLGRSRVIQPGESLTQSVNKFNPNWLGKQFINDPLAKSVMTGSNMFGKGVQWTGKKVAGAGKYAFGTPSGLLFMGAPVTIMGTKWLLSDGTELNDDQKRQVKQSGPPGGGDPGMTYTKPPVTKSAEELAAEAKAARTKKLNKYLDTMGYDKAKKTAMGDALIDASAIVQDATTEAGSLKKADWGKMINKAIQTTSKRLDKPEQIREAVGLMMTKADIEKDATAEEDALNKLVKQLQIKGYQKTLAGETLQESINAAFQKSGKFPTGSTLAGVARTKGIEVTKVIPTTDIPDDMSAISYITTITENAKNAGKPYPKGHYVIKDRLVEIDVNGDIIKQVI